MGPYCYSYVSSYNCVHSAIKSVDLSMCDLATFNANFYVANDHGLTPVAEEARES